MGFPQPGSLEFVASGHALDRLAEQAANASSRVRSSANCTPSGKEVLGADAVQAAHDGDPSAQRMVEIWGQRVGIGVANAINTFDPEEVVIGGGAARAGDLLLEPAKRVARGYVVPGLGTRTNDPAGSPRRPRRGARRRAAGSPGAPGPASGARRR